MSDHMINTNGAAIRVEESGAGEPALIFLHYWGGSSRTWRSVIDRLGGRPRCIALDQRGWGASTATDGRYGLYALADDVEAVTHQLGLDRYVLVGHSMGGKVAQIVAARRPKELVGLVLVAPAPPTPMPVPEVVRNGMFQSYGSREGALQALAVLGGQPLSSEFREQVIEDVTAGLDAVKLPVAVIVGDRDQVEHEVALRKIFARFLPQASFLVLQGIGHLSPLEAPDALANACKSLLHSLERLPR